MSRLVVGTNYADSVPIINKGTYYYEKKKYGLTVNGYIGNVDNTHTLINPNYTGTPDFSEVKYFTREAQFKRKFAHNSGITGDVKFGLERTVPYALQQCFLLTNITGLTFDNLQEIAHENVFEEVCNYCSLLEAVSFDGLETITGNKAFYRAFKSCSGLQTASFHNLVSIQASQVFDEAFYGCGYLQSIDFSSLHEIVGDRACYRIGFQSGITELNLPQLGFIEGNMAFMDGFYNAPNLELVNVPILAHIEGNQNFCEAFCNTIVDTANFSNLIDITGNNNFEVSFSNCSSLDYINFNSLTSIHGTNNFDSAFADCTSLEYFRFRDLESLYDGSYTSGNFYLALYGCTNIKIVRFDALYDFQGSNPIDVLSHIMPYVEGQTTPSPTDIYLLNFNTATSSAVASWGTAVLGQMLGTGRTRSCRIHLLEVTRDGLIAAQGNEDNIMAALGASSSFGDSIVWAKSKFTDSNNREYTFSPRMGNINTFGWATRQGVSYRYVYTTTDVPSVGDPFYSDPECTDFAGTIVSVYPEANN